MGWIWGVDVCFVLSGGCLEFYSCLVWVCVGMGGCDSGMGCFALGVGDLY